jgi:regulator of replication initiation timing
VQALQSREKTLLEENTRLELEMEQLAAAVGLPRVIVLLDGDGVYVVRPDRSSQSLKRCLAYSRANS